MPYDSNTRELVWHNATITRNLRQEINQHKSIVLWFTGLSGSGKSTIAHAVEEELYRRKCRTYVLDGDNIRHGLSNDLGFSDLDRRENIRRISETAKLFLDAGIITLTAFISPFREDRKAARALIAHGEFLEIYCRCPLAVCEQRDVKGMYKKAKNGQIKLFTGISSPYEEPSNPELTLDTDRDSLELCVSEVINLLTFRGIFHSHR